MKDVLSRLRAALTPQAVLLLLAAMLLFSVASGARRGSDPAGGSSLEARISRTLSSMEGAGRVQVTIRTREIETGSGALGAGKTEAVPCGAVAVAQGADDPLVKMALCDALCALLGLPYAAVSVVAGGK